MTGTAAGNIAPMRFVSRSRGNYGANGTDDAQFVQTTSNLQPVAGISGIGTRYPPYSTLDDGLIAVAGENFRLFTPPQEEAALELGAACNAGAMLMSDADGKGIPGLPTGIGHYVGAQAIMAGQPGEIIIVKPMFGRGT
jgi:hypothetical protein